MEGVGDARTKNPTALYRRDAEETEVNAGVDEPQAIHWPGAKGDNPCSSR